MTTLFLEASGDPANTSDLARPRINPDRKDAKSGKMTVQEPELRYSFGKNWSEFIDAGLNNKIIDDSQRHMANMLRTEKSRRQSFLGYWLRIGHPLAGRAATRRRTRY